MSSPVRRPKNRSPGRPNSALSSNSELDQAGPRPSTFLGSFRGTFALERGNQVLGVPKRVGFHYLWARQVAYQVQVSGGGFVLAQVDTTTRVIRCRQFFFFGRTSLAETRPVVNGTCVYGGLPLGRRRTRSTSTISMRSNCCSGGPRLGKASRRQCGQQRSSGRLISTRRPRAKSSTAAYACTGTSRLCFPTKAASQSVGRHLRTVMEDNSSR